MKKNLLYALLIVTAGLFAVCPAVAEEYVPGDVLVVFKAEEGARVTTASLNMGRDAFRVASIATAAGAWVKDTYSGLSVSENSIFALLHSDTRTTEDLVEEFLSRDDVIAASPNAIAHITRDSNDPVSPARMPGTLWGLETIGAPEAWDTTTGDKNVYVAIIDTGIDPTHPDLKDNIDTSRSRNFTTSDPSAYGDDNGHGTHVAGTVGAAGDNGIGLVGINWNVGIIALKSMGADGNGLVSNIIKALDYLTGLLNDDANLKLAAVNLSLAVCANLEPTAANQAREPLWRAMKALDRKNRTLIAVAAGNEGLEVGVPSPKNDPSGNNVYKKGDYVFPASFKGLNNMLSVAALSRDLAVPSFSNYNADIAAPGVGIISTFPQESPSAAQDKQYSATTLEDGSRVGTANGTSMATPHVAGAAALLLAADPSRTAYQIRAALLSGNQGSTASGEKILSLSEARKYQAENPNLTREHARDEYDTAYENYKDSDFIDEFVRSISSGGGCDAVLGGLPFLLLPLPLCRRRSGRGRR